jgi:glycosyltransferase involved in cell wall biosynthesis
VRLAINATSAHMGGAVTYLRSVLPELARRMAAAGEGRTLLWAPRGALGDTAVPGLESRDPGGAANANGLGGIGRRLWFDQVELPRRLREDRADALYSSANFGTLRPGVRQALLIRNPVYFDPLIFERIHAPRIRAQYRLQRELALASIRAADVVLFPTRAMQDMVTAFTGRVLGDWRVAPYGARRDLFRPADGRPARTGPAELLHVSLYCDHKNVRTLLAALERLEARRPGGHRLRLTAGFGSIEPGPLYPDLAGDREAFARLAARGVAQDVERRAYASLPELYRSSDVFVFPSYTESFGHPLVEAMASGLPVVAADVPVNREMCGDAALYFRTFDPDDFAATIERVTGDAALYARLREEGLARAREFTWERHVDVLWSALRGDGS